MKAKFKRVRVVRFVKDMVCVDFLPCNDAGPGITHRVIINGSCKDWLGHGKPDAKAAQFFYDKHFPTPK